MGVDTSGKGNKHCAGFVVGELICSPWQVNIKINHNRNSHEDDVYVILSGQALFQTQVVYVIDLHILKVTCDCRSLNR